MAGAENFQFFLAWRSSAFGHRDGLAAAEVLPGQTRGIFANLLQGTAGDNLTATHSRPRPEIHDQVGCTDRVFIVFNHDHGVAQVAELLEACQQPGVVSRVQTDARFIQNVEYAHQAAADLPC
ncbi:hypothetical protein HRbin36_01921 [bacterium HR36]|nr:hypothetical protein HRbin36_01921 [bacterium HR36]